MLSLDIKSVARACLVERRRKKRMYVVVGIRSLYAVDDGKLDRYVALCVAALLYDPLPRVNDLFL